jgi:hypothetical protein
VAVDFLEDTRNRGTFSTTRVAGHNDKPLLKLTYLAPNPLVGQAQAGGVRDMARQGPDNSRKSVRIEKGIYPEPQS